MIWQLLLLVGYGARDFTVAFDLVETIRRRTANDTCTYKCQNAATEPPTSIPTAQPTAQPTDDPTDAAQTGAPSTSPTETMTAAPTQSLTEAPTAGGGTGAPTPSPSVSPTQTSTDAPSLSPTQTSTDAPSLSPTQTSTDAPTQQPSQNPTVTSTNAPTQTLTQAPTQTSTDAPTQQPSMMPSMSLRRLEEQDTWEADDDFWVDTPAPTIARPFERRRRLSDWETEFDILISQEKYFRSQNGIDMATFQDVCHSSCLVAMDASDVCTDNSTDVHENFDDDCDDQCCTIGSASCSPFCTNIATSCCGSDDSWPAKVEPVEKDDDKDYTNLFIGIGVAGGLIVLAAIAYVCCKSKEEGATGSGNTTEMASGTGTTPGTVQAV